MPMMILVLMLVAAITLFSVQNATSVTVVFLLWRFDASLAIVVLLAALTGMMLGLMIHPLRRMRHAWRRRHEPPHKPPTSTP